MILENQLIMNTTPTKNLHVYSIEVLESIVRQINEMTGLQRIGVVGDKSAEAGIHNSAFIFRNPRIVDDSLVLDIELLETPVAEELKTSILLNNDPIVFRPAGQATMPADADMMKMLKVPVKIGADYRFKTIQAIPKSEDALEFPDKPNVDWVEMGSRLPDLADSEYNSKKEKDD